MAQLLVLPQYFLVSVCGFKLCVPFAQLEQAPLAGWHARKALLQRLKPLFLRTLRRE
jgi:hypothetical protein